MSRGRIVALIVVLLAVGGWYGATAYKKYVNNPARVAAAKQAREQADNEAKYAKEQADAEAHNKAVAEAQNKDYQKAVTAVEKKRQALADKGESTPVFRLTPKELFPLKEQPKALLKAAESTSSRRAPVVFLAPLYGASGDSTTPTIVLESMLRYQLRPALPGPVALNLIPLRHIKSPYVRVGGDSVERNRPIGDYVRDASLIGSDILVYGRADLVQNNPAIQLALVDLRTSRTEAYSLSVTPDKLSDLVGGAVSAIARFSGISEADLNASGMNPTTAALPDGASFLSALSGTVDSDSTQGRARIAQSTKPSPWLYDSVVEGLEDDGGVEILNEALQRWPDDPRLLLAKADSLLKQNSFPQAYLLNCEFVRRQADSLVASSALQATLYAINNIYARNPLLPVGYGGAMKHADSLLKQHPKNWGLRWDAAAGAANTAYRLPGFVLAEASSDGTTDPQKLTPEDLASVAEKYKNLPEQAVAGIKAALELRPDNPEMIGTLIYWHDRLTDHEGDDAPEKAIEWQYPLLTRIHLLDPQRYRPDLIVAAQQAGTTGPTHMKILTDLVERTNWNPEAMEWVSSHLVQVIHLRMEWDYETDHRAEVGRLNRMPEAKLFAETFERALANDEPVDSSQENMALLVAMGYPEYNPLWNKMYAYKNGHYKAAFVAMKEENWKEALKHAERVRGLVGEKEYELMSYDIIKSLWKLGRKREALYEAEVATANMPNSSKLHYMFAVVACELNDRLEEALVRARIAEKMDPKNTGIREVIGKLEAKLKNDSVASGA